MSSSTRIPAWKLLLSWLLERGDIGISVPELLTMKYEGRLLGASYRQRMVDIRRKIGQDAIRADSRIVDGAIHTVFWIPQEKRQAAREMLYAGAHPMEYPNPPAAPHLAETERLFEDGAPDAGRYH